jgi:predicted CoA-substrate-specific enzyme activase
MITAGIDAGAKRAKVVILKDAEIIGKSIATTGLEEKKGIQEAFETALNEAGVSKDDLDKIISTGMGTDLVEMADGSVTINIADARGMYKLLPTVKTIIDVGAEEGRVITCSDGRVNSYTLNDRCAAGAGTFVDSMARILEVSAEEFGEMALRSEDPSEISAQCTVFAESEVISLVSSDKSVEDIARSVVNAIAERVNAMTMKLTVEPDVALIGGTARNKGLVEALTNLMEVDNLMIPDDPEYIGALGAAIVAVDKAA